MTTMALMFLLVGSAILFLSVFLGNTEKLFPFFALPMITRYLILLFTDVMPLRAIDAVYLTVWLWLLWKWLRRRKNRRRIMKMLGAKSRALRDKLVRSLRDSMQPSPVRIPA